MNAGAWTAQAGLEVRADAFGQLRQPLRKALLSLVEMNVEARRRQRAEAQRRIVALTALGRGRQA